MTVQLIDPEETYTVTAAGIDRRAFEREGRAAIGAPPTTPTAQLYRSMPESAIAWLAWHALIRTGQWVGDLATFDARCDAVAVETGDPEADAALALADPTRPAP